MFQFYTIFKFEMSTRLMNHQKCIGILITDLLFQQKYQISTSFSFPNVKIWCFSLWYMIQNGIFQILDSWPVKIVANIIS